MGNHDTNRVMYHGGVLDRLGPDFDLLGNEFIHKAGIVGDVNLERFAVGRFPGKGIP